jgi:hypothetical protein
MPIWPKAIYRFKTTSSNLNDILHRSRKKLRVHMGAQKTPNSQSSPDTEGITISDFKLCYRARVTKTTSKW